MEGFGVKVRDLDVNEFKALIQEVIEEKLEEMLGDPDLGLELQGKGYGDDQRPLNRVHPRNRVQFTQKYEININTVEY